MRLETFFFIFAKKKNSSKNGQYFHRKQKEKWEKNKFAAARLASILATRCTGNRIFFGDSLIEAIWEAAILFFFYVFFFLCIEMVGEIQ